MQSLKMFRKAVDLIVNWLMILMFTVIFLVVLAQIYYRYVKGSPLIWSEEFSRFIFIWVSLMGWVLATRSGSHIRITFFEERLPQLVRKPLRILFKILTLAFLAALAYLGTLMSVRTMNRGAVAIPEIPIGMFYAALPLSAVLGIFYTVYDFIVPAAGNDAPAVME